MLDCKISAVDRSYRLAREKEGQKLESHAKPKSFRSKKSYKEI